MKRFTKISTLLAAAVYSVIGFPGAAFAYTDPIRRQGADAVTTGVQPAAVSTQSSVASAGWSPAAVIAVAALIVLGVALALAFGQLSRRRRTAQTPALAR